MEKLKLKLKNRVGTTRRTNGAESDGHTNHNDDSSIGSGDGMQHVKQERSKAYASVAPDRGGSNMHTPIATSTNTHTHVNAHTHASRDKLDMHVRKNVGRVISNDHGLASSRTQRKLSSSTSELGSPRNYNTAPIRQSGRRRPLLDVFKTNRPPATLTGGVNDGAKSPNLDTSSRSRSESNKVRSRATSSASAEREGPRSASIKYSGTDPFASELRTTQEHGPDFKRISTTEEPSEDKASPYAVNTNIESVLTGSSALALSTMPGGVAAEQYIDGSSRPVSQFSRVGVHFRNNDGTPLPDGHASTARAFCPQSHFFMYTQVAPPQRITGIGQTPPIQGNGEREKGGKHFAHSKASFKSEQTLKPTGMGLGSSHTNLATIGSESGLNDRAESVKFKPIKSPGKRHSSSNSATAMTRGTSSTSDTQGLSTSHTGTSSATARRVQSTLLPVSTSGSTTINSSNSNMNASANQTASNTPVANPSANESDTNANAEDPYPHTVYCVAVPVTVANNMMSIYSVCFSFFIRGDLLSRYAEGAGGTDQTGIVLGVSDQSMHWEDIPAGNIRGKVVGLKEPFIMFSLQSFSEESTTPTLDGVVLGLANEETILQVLRDILPVSDNAFGEECMLLHTSNSSQPIADNRLFLSKDVSVLNGLILYTRPIAPKPAATPTPSRHTRRASQHSMGDLPSSSNRPGALSLSEGHTLGINERDRADRTHTRTESNDKAGYSDVKAEAQGVIDGLGQQMDLVNRIKEHVGDMRDKLDAVTKVSNFLTDQVQNALNVGLQEMKQRQNLAINSLHTMKTERADVRDRIARVEKSVEELNRYFASHAERLDKVVRRMEAYMMRRRIGTSKRCLWVCVCSGVGLMYWIAAAMLAVAQSCLRMLHRLWLRMVNSSDSERIPRGFHRLTNGLQIHRGTMEDSCRNLFATVSFFFTHALFDEGQDIDGAPDGVASQSSDSIYYPYASDYAFTLMIFMSMVAFVTIVGGF